MMHPLFDLSGRVALVTGAAQNMGRNSALALAEAGADLLVADINLPGVEDTAHCITEMGRRALALRLDLASEEQIRNMYRRLDAEFGHVDVVANIPGNNMLGHP